MLTGTTVSATKYSNALKQKAYIYFNIIQWLII